MRTRLCLALDADLDTAVRAFSGTAGDRRIWANGMAIALFANQFVAWGLASSFFPMVNAWGYGPVFFGFAASGVLYFLTVLFIPETKGLPLERLEHLFDGQDKGEPLL